MQSVRSLPLGRPYSELAARLMVNAEGWSAIVVEDHDEPKLLLTAGTDAREGQITVTLLDDGVEVSRNREAAARWVASGSVTAGPPSAPVWANVLGLAIVIFVFGLLVIGAVTVVGWIVGALS